MNRTFTFQDEMHANPHITLSIADKSWLTAVACQQDDYPSINIYLCRNGKEPELICFAEYNPERSPCHEICIGTYQSDDDETKYYAPYRAERNHNGTKKICPARKLTWDEIAHLMDLEIQGVLNRSVHCRAFLEDTLYWGAAATDYRFSIAELKELLWAAHAELDDWKETIPSDSDGSKSLGMGLSNCLLHSALHAEWECEHCTEEALWLLNYREISGKQETETDDILNLPGVSVRVSELKTRHDLLSYLFENGPSHSSLMDFCDSYRELYHNELCWPYPISDGKHLGTFLIPVRKVF